MVAFCARLLHILAQAALHSASLYARRVALVSGSGRAARSRTCEPLRPAPYCANMALRVRDAVLQLSACAHIHGRPSSSATQTLRTCKALSRPFAFARLLL
jgi:hypothetical protein